MTNGKKRGVHITDDSTINILSLNAVASWSTDTNLYGGLSLHEETVLAKMKYLIFAFLGAVVIYLIYVNYMIRAYPNYFFIS